MIGTIAAAGGTLASGLYGSAVASNNAKIAGYNATYAREAGAVEAQDRGLKGAEQVGRIKTATAANGIDINSGSTQNVITSQKESTDVDIERIFHNADLSAYGYSTQKQNYENEAGFDILQGVTGAASTLAEKAPSLNFKWGNSPGSSAADSWGWSNLG